MNSHDTTFHLIIEAKDQGRAATGQTDPPALLGGGARKQRISPINLVDTMEATNDDMEAGRISKPSFPSKNLPLRPIGPRSHSALAHIDPRKNKKSTLFKTS